MVRVNFYQLIKGVYLEFEIGFMMVDWLI